MIIKLTEEVEKTIKRTFRESVEFEYKQLCEDFNERVTTMLEFERRRAVGKAEELVVKLLMKEKINVEVEV